MRLVRLVVVIGTVAVVSQGGLLYAQTASIETLFTEPSGDDLLASGATRGALRAHVASNRKAVRLSRVYTAPSAETTAIVSGSPSIRKFFAMIIGGLRALPFGLILGRSTSFTSADSIEVGCRVTAEWYGSSVSFWGELTLEDSVTHALFVSNWTANGGEVFSNVFTTFVLCPKQH